MITLYGRISSEALLRPTFIFALLVLCSYACLAQTTRPLDFIGFEASFGTRTFEVKSSIAAIDNMPTLHEGGQLGIVFGKKMWKTRIQVAGFYYAGGNTPHNQDLFETATYFNIYPTAWVQKEQHGLFPYLMTGLCMTQIKFFGTYLADQPGHSAYEPYLGKSTQFGLASGIGLEYRLRSDVDIIHVFAEASLSQPVLSHVSSDVFSGTQIKQYALFNIGVSFGSKRR
jgi:hypothetical protein